MKQLLVITELWRTVGIRPVGSVCFRPMEMDDYFPMPLSWRSFKVGSSEHDGPCDEVYCPCGDIVYLGNDYWVLGDFVDAAVDHIAEKHPGVRGS